MQRSLRQMLAGSASAVLVVAGLALVAPSAASAAPSSCAPNERTVVAAYGSPTYAAIGSAAGKDNGASSTGPLSVQVSFTTSRSTGWTASASASVGWGIAEVEASTSYSVTSTTSTGRSVIDVVSVAAHHYSYAQPKAEYRKFHIYDVETNPNCTTSVTHDYGYLNAITSYHSSPSA